MATVYSYFLILCDLGSVKLLTRGGGYSIVCELGEQFRNIIPFTSAQQFDRSKLTNEISLLMTRNDIMLIPESHPDMKTAFPSAVSVLRFRRRMARRQK